MPTIPPVQPSFGPTKRRIKNVYVPSQLTSAPLIPGDAEATRFQPIRRIIIQLDDGSFLETDGLEVVAKMERGKSDSVRITTTSDCSVTFYDPEEFAL